MRRHFWRLQKAVPGVNAIDPRICQYYSIQQSRNQFEIGQTAAYKRIFHASWSPSYDFWIYIFNASV
jgi:hypothetical protein